MANCIQQRQAARAEDMGEGHDQVGQVRTAIQSEKTGSVLTRGEIWVAKSDGDDISEGVRVRVVDVKGMTLTVAPVKTKSYESSEA